MKFHSNQIGIAGAGIAGLVAANELLAAGHAVSIFESRPGTGGRIQQVHFSGIAVASGPEFIHGNLTGTIALLKKYHIPFEPVHGKMYQFRNGELMEANELTGEWELLLIKMRSLKKDLPLFDFLSLNFPGSRFTALRESAIRFAEGYDLADVKKASTHALLKEWEREEDGQYRIHGGYTTLIHSLENEFISNGGKLYLNHPVATVNWETDHIELRCNKNQVFHMEKLIICLPLPALSHAAPPDETIHFIPSAYK